MSEANDTIIAKLDEFEERFGETSKQLEDPEINSDTAKVIKLSKELGKLRGTVEKYRQYKSMLEEIVGAQLLLDDADTDAEMKQMAADEIEELEGKKTALLEDIKSDLVMGDDASIDAVIMEIRAGTGGEEAALFARNLYDMYLRYAEKRKWKVEQFDFSPTDKGGFREVTIGIKGAGVWSELGYEGGGHRVQRVPETESQGRVHTSAATVAVLPEPDTTDIEINPADVLEHISRAGGPGGQSVNKINSAIKLEHVPTGITVSMREEKSQHKNRAKAWRVLRSRIYEHFEQKKRAERDAQRKTMIGSGDRSQRIRTYNFPQNRLTDHRINLTLYSLDKIIMGELDEVINALKEHDRQLRLKNL